MKKYTIQSEKGNLTIRTEVEPKNLNIRLNQISKAMKLSTLIVTEPDGHTFTWMYNAAVEAQEQFKTLIVQNFKDRWEEAFTQLIKECQATGEINMTEEEYRKLDWEYMKDEFLSNYLLDLQKLIEKKSGLFQ